MLRTCSASITMHVCTAKPSVARIGAPEWTQVATVHGKIDQCTADGEFRGITLARMAQSAHSCHCCSGGPVSTSNRAQTAPGTGLPDRSKTMSCPR